MRIEFEVKKTSEGKLYLESDDERLGREIVRIYLDEHPVPAQALRAALKAEQQ